MAAVLSDKDYPALEVMADILGGGFQSRLFQKVRTQLGYAYDVSSSWARQLRSPRRFRDHQQHQVRQHRRNASKPSTRKSQRIRTQEVTEEELQSAKDTVLNGFIFNFDTPSKTLNRLLTYRYYGYPDDFIFQYQKAVGRSRAPTFCVSRSNIVDPAKFVIVAVGNPKDFSTPLSSLGHARQRSRYHHSRASESPLPAPSAAIGPPQPKGAALLAKMAQAMGGEANLTAIKDMTQKAELDLDPAAGGLKATQTELWISPATIAKRTFFPSARSELFGRQDRMGRFTAGRRGHPRRPSASRSPSRFSACGPRC